MNNLLCYEVIKWYYNFYHRYKGKKVSRKDIFNKDNENFNIQNISENESIDSTEEESDDETNDSNNEENIDDSNNEQDNDNKFK